MTLFLALEGICVAECCEAPPPPYLPLELPQTWSGCPWEHRNRNNICLCGCISTLLLTADILSLMNMGFKSTCQLFKNKDIIERLNIKKSDIEEKKNI